jgi:hypothetical protein
MTFIDFDKIGVFCGKCYVHIDKCVPIVVKIKYVNSDKICDICNKINFIIKLYTLYNT